MLVIVVRPLAEADGAGFLATVETEERGSGTNTYFSRGVDADAAARELARLLLQRGFCDSPVRVSIFAVRGHVVHGRLSLLAGTAHRPARRFVVGRPAPHAVR